MFNTCAIANAIETFDVRLRNAGFVDASIRCFFEDLPPTVGFAATARLRTSQPPMRGRSYQDRTDWWSSILRIPAPRVVVLEDMDHPAGLGAFVGEVHAHILSALGAVAIVTNGAVRDLSEVHAAGFQCFARQPAVSHAYAHIFEFGTSVEIGGLKIQPGDLLHGDRHGLLSVPLDLAPQLPEVAAQLIARDRRVIQLCESADFSLDRLRALIAELDHAADHSPRSHDPAPE